MNEPNDTAQEGFDQLKRNLEVRYPEDSDLSLDEFLNVESLLALAVRVCGPGADPRKADRLLSNYQLIRPESRYPPGSSPRGFEPAFRSPVPGYLPCCSPGRLPGREAWGRRGPCRP